MSRDAASVCSAHQQPAGVLARSQRHRQHVHPGERQQRSRRRRDKKRRTNARTCCVFLVPGSSRPFTGSHSPHIVSSLS
ncbi:hypothetical protein CHARACLAT_023681 [Characodon lateralis]|uniref:Uncharacterized protein n=1 Tax=Characodon lateralis TaxID=208331 RepID=A0ABU7ELP1_9TELE|nr:hypothetical protein [Characodon lateralis]